MPGGEVLMNGEGEVMLAPEIEVSRNQPLVDAAVWHWVIPEASSCNYNSCRKGIAEMDNTNRSDKHGPAIPAGQEAANLRRTLPKIATLHFSEPREYWPSRPIYQRDVRPVESQPLLGTVTEEQLAEITKSALRDERVRVLLGSRFAHISTDLFGFRKDLPRKYADAPRTRLTCFSYTYKTAVEILMRGVEVETAYSLKGNQPPEAYDEVRDAVRIARQDRRFADKIERLEAHGILLPLTEEQGREHQRLIWLTFTEPSDGGREMPALITVVVDLIDRKILMARAEPPLEGDRNYAK